MIGETRQIVITVFFAVSLCDLVVTGAPYSRLLFVSDFEPVQSSAHGANHFRRRVQDTRNDVTPVYEIQPSFQNSVKAGEIGLPADQSKINSESENDSWLRDDLYEGDLIGINDQTYNAIVAELMTMPDQVKFGYRNAFSHKSRLWPNGQIAYVISPEYSPQQRSRILAAMEAYHRQTCIRWIPKSTEEDFVFIFPDYGNGCYSEPGRRGGLQRLSLEPRCLGLIQTIIHELMHVVGFLHEQSRPDRDDYVDIHWDNIRPHSKGQFHKARRTMTLGLPYDYGSILHYHGRTFSHNGEPTITSKTPGQRVGPNRLVEFSALDVIKINTLYNCPGLVPQSVISSHLLPQNTVLGTTITDQSLPIGQQPQIQIGEQNFLTGQNNGNQQLIQPFNQNSDKTLQLNHQRPSISNNQIGSSFNNPFDVSSRTTTLISLCADKAGHCAFWSNAGFCTIGVFTSYMLEHCRQTCRFCNI